MSAGAWTMLRTDEQGSHDEPVEAGDFASEFAPAMLENCKLPDPHRPKR